MRRVIWAAMMVLAVSFAGLGGDLPGGKKEKLGRMEGLDKRLAVVDQAPTLEELIRNVKPQFDLGHGDYVWIAHNKDGKPGFVMNRAYEVNRAGKVEVCFLNAVGVEVVATTGEKQVFEYRSPEEVEYFRAAVEKPEVVGRDAKRGVVYAAVWRSAILDGSGSNQTDRNLFFLCDGEHRWRLVGEGPEDWRGKCGVSDCTVTRMEVTGVRWTDEAHKPVEIAFTQVTVRGPASEALLEELKPLEIRRDGVLAGGLPGKWEWRGASYTVAAKGETLEELVLRVARWEAGYDDQRAEKQAGVLKRVREVIEKANPGLPSEIGGRRIELGERMGEVE